jgi:hypothetical protein
MLPDQSRSYECLDETDLARLGRVADAEINAFFARNPHLGGWRDRLRIVALAQGSAEHYLRGRRGIWDLDVIVCFADDPRLPRLFRRMIVSWDWGPSKFGRCPYDPPEYTGRAVDIAFWVIPDQSNAVDGLREWLTARAAKQDLWTSQTSWPGAALIARRHPDAGLPAPGQTAHHSRCGESRDERGERDNDIDQRIADWLEHGVPFFELDIADRSG